MWDADPYSRYSGGRPICTFINPEWRHGLWHARSAGTAPSQPLIVLILFIGRCRCAAATGAGVGIPRVKEEDKEGVFDPYKAQMSLVTTLERGRVGVLKYCATAEY